MRAQPAQFKPSPYSSLQKKRWYRKKLEQCSNLNSEIRFNWKHYTYSMEYSFSLTGIQYTNWIALHRRWNSEHSSIFMTPLLGGWPCQIGSSTKVLILVSTISNMDRPQHSLSLVSRSPSAAMSACYAQNKGSESNSWLPSLGVRVCTVLILSNTEKRTTFSGYDIWWKLIFSTR